MPSIIDLLLGRESRLYPFEVSAIEAVINRLDRRSGARLRQQIEAINKVQRLTGGKEVNLYRMSHGKAIFDDGLRFSGVEEEKLLASVSLVPSVGNKTPLKIELWLANGRLFSLLFNKKPKEFFSGDQLRAVQPRIVDVKICFDPMLPSENVRAEAKVSLGGWLEVLQKKGLVSEINIPMKTQKRVEALECINAVPPADYVDLLSQTDGAKIGEYIILGSEKIRKIVLPDENYYVLVDVGTNGGLVIKESGQDGELYLLKYEDGSLCPMGISLRNAVERMLSMPPS